MNFYKLLSDCVLQSETAEERKLISEFLKRAEYCKLDFSRYYDPENIMSSVWQEYASLKLTNKLITAIEKMQRQILGPLPE